LSILGWSFTLRQDFEPQGTELDEVVAAVAANTSIAAKRSIGLVSDVLGPTGWVAGPGDDGAALDVDGRTVIACGEALWPPFVQRDPYGAGIAAVLANVNDIAAMGGIPLGIVDTIVADEVTARAALGGMRYASELYRVPIVGGHLTISDGPPALSAFAVGSADAVLSTTNVEAGQDLVVAACLDGTMREDFPFFRSFEERGPELADDVRLLRAVAISGLAVAAKDISMAGLVGSLAMLLEWGAFGATVDLRALPAPAGVPLARWCNCFPCFGFLLTCVPERTEACVAAFTGRGLSAARVGSIDPSGQIVLTDGERSAVVADLSRVPVTGLRRP
jgi:selenophosphate synthetase-related protein